MRGTRTLHGFSVTRLRIIPAHAGNTGHPPADREPFPDHPRACGEHSTRAIEASSGSGSSPRMRGTLFANPPRPPRKRIIPAHAGNTGFIRFHLGRLPDHPRACGEHIEKGERLLHTAGSSPRMRGTLPDHSPGNSSCRIIPAHAGNTGPAAVGIATFTDHPRACGEHSTTGTRLGQTGGSSPRMRGTHTNPAQDFGVTRIIPAHAGNTKTLRPRQRLRPDHPRACGEHAARGRLKYVLSGSSPRMRGTRNEHGIGDVADRIIPAHAGNTTDRDRECIPPADHPRACGEHSPRPAKPGYRSGSSPRMRGTPKNRKSAAIM